MLSNICAAAGCIVAGCTIIVLSGTNDSSNDIHSSYCEVKTLLFIKRIINLISLYIKINIFVNLYKVTVYQGNDFVGANI